jgi:hypothetical protein
LINSGATAFIPYPKEEDQMTDPNDPNRQQASLEMGVAQLVKDADVKNERLR